jgi:hypothetical protein
MGTAPSGQPNTQLSKPSWWQVHGTTASWIALVFSLITALGMGINVYLGISSRSRADSDQHTNYLIDQKLNPAIEKFNTHVDEKLGPLSNKLDALSGRVDKVEQRVEDIKELKLRVGSNEQNLNRLLNPADTLASIRNHFQDALAQKKILPENQIANYKSTVRLISPLFVGELYFQTMAATINYQSFLSQKSGNAPDPRLVSQDCPFTQGTANFFEGPISDCVVRLDTQRFEDATFKDSVVIYNGGPVVLKNVTFINCRFILSFPKNAIIDPRRVILLGRLFDSPNLRTVNVTTHE